MWPFRCVRLLPSLPGSVLFSFLYANIRRVFVVVVGFPHFPPRPYLWGRLIKVSFLFLFALRKYTDVSPLKCFSIFFPRVFPPFQSLALFARLVPFLSFRPISMRPCRSSLISLQKKNCFCICICIYICVCIYKYFLLLLFWLLLCLMVVVAAVSLEISVSFFIYTVIFFLRFPI